MLAPWNKSYDQPRQYSKKHRLYFATKVLSSQSYGFSSSHEWIWELDHKERWTPKNWCFCTAVLEKTPESPLDCKKIQWVNLKGNQSWIFIGRTGAEAKTPIFWLPYLKNWLIWEDNECWERLKLGGEGADRGWDGWMVSLTQRTWVSVKSGSWFGQGGLACCDSWGSKESDMTERLIWSDLTYLSIYASRYVGIYLLLALTNTPVNILLYMPKGSLHMWLNEGS